MGMNTFRYDPVMVQPMREELTSIGFEELLTPEEVDGALAGEDGTVLVVVNSVCGCAAGSARPGVRLSLEAGPRPDRLTTVFAGMETAAVERAREYFVGYPPSSPQVALFENGQLVHMMERQDIEGLPAQSIADNLRGAFGKYCAT
ncbi:MAG: BrxA/BrxB family bacilliredoxin [Gemmatimonadales bacterium]